MVHAPGPPNNYRGLEARKGSTAKVINTLRFKGEMKENKLRRRDFNEILRQCGDSLGQGREESPGGRKMVTGL